MFLTNEEGKSGPELQFVSQVMVASMMSGMAYGAFTHGSRGAIQCVKKEPLENQ